MSASTFKKLFNSNILASGASIYCNKENEFIKNIDVLKGWGIPETDFISYFNQLLNINIESITIPENKNFLKKIKKISNNKITEIINSNRTISKFIFQGIGNFQEPFTAFWLFEHGIFKANYKIPFKITTGSGRSKGIYTIVLKPK